MLFGTKCLEIFRSVQADGGLEEEAVANTRRRRVFPSTARADIECPVSLDLDFVRPADQR
ncbi:hypothetical protein [Streptomyces sp. UG1]|uniref:hypothetical protein n=1 Tax=Streptomyces sp. UG1 TaxID=3417652 RepID=UPI003CEB3A76